MLSLKVGADCGRARLDQSRIEMVRSVLETQNVGVGEIGVAEMVSVSVALKLRSLPI